MGKKSGSLPVNRFADRNPSGIFFKHTADSGAGAPLTFPHRDDYYMFSVLTEGEMSATVDFKDITLHAGEGIVISPGVVHFPKPGYSAPEAWSLFVSPDRVPDPCRTVLEQYALDIVPLHFVPGRYADIERLFGMLRTYGDDLDFAGDLAAVIIRLFCGAVVVPESGCPGRYVALTMLLKRLLAEKIVEEKRPAAYASMMNISGVYLNEAVKSATGLSVGEYIRAQVITNARRLLAHTSMTVQEVGEALGYDDYSYFSRLFRKMSGMTPTDFRKKLG